MESKQERIWATSEEGTKLSKEVWDNSGSPYTSYEEKAIMAGFLLGQSLKCLCEKFKRPPSGIIERLRKQGLVVKEAVMAGRHGIYDVLITHRGQTMRRDHAATESQRAALAAQAAKLTAKEDAAMLTTGEGNLLKNIEAAVQDGRIKIFHEAGVEAIMPLSNGNLVWRKPDGTPAVTIGLIPDPQAESLETETSTFISCENIMNASINIAVNVTLNGKAVTAYSDNDLLDLLTQQESKIKLLAEITAEKSARRDELLEAAKQQRDDLLKLLDSRAKGGDSVLAVATQIVGRKAAQTLAAEAAAVEVKAAE